MREFLGFMLSFCLRFLFIFGVFAFLASWFLSTSFNRDGSMSREVVVIPAIIFTGMIVFFYMCISELKDIASKINTLSHGLVVVNKNIVVVKESIVDLNQNIVAIYKENKGK